MALILGWPSHGESCPILPLWKCQCMHPLGDGLPLRQPQVEPQTAVELLPDAVRKGAQMDNARGCLGTAAMMFFGATVLIGWIMMVILPVLAGGPPIADIGLLVMWTVISLIIWRVAGGRGWGLAPEEATTAAENQQQATTPRSSSSESLLPSDWSAALASMGLSDFDLQATLARAYGNGHPGTVLPDRRKVFRPFALTPLRSVRVVVLGQDPYPTPGRPDGLAFSVQPGVSAPNSLTRIFSNLETDSALHFSRPSNGNLTRWANNGVLLLNAALTVREDAPGSHRDFWKHFTYLVLKVINEKTDPVVFILLGDHANALADAVPINQSRHLVIRSTHPRRDESSRYPRFAESRPFSDANNFLLSRGRGAVDWTL